MNKCVGCGSLLQTDNPDIEGYTKNINNPLCERCFRIKNYSDYKLISKDNNDFINILNNIGSTNSLVVLVVDLFNIPLYLEDINKYIKNDILLVLTKRDIIPLSVYDVNLINYFKNYNLNNLIDSIRKYKHDKNVYVVGFTNAGKSTMINKLIYNYTDNKPVITTSMLPSTTIDSIEISIDDDLTLIDTPGLLDDGNIIDYVDINTMKKIVPNKEIKPRTYQVKVQQTLFIDNLVRLDIEDNNNLTFYISNMLEVERTFKDIDKLKDLKKYELDVKKDNDIVISGLGFIKCTNSGHITLYTLDKVLIYIRESLI